MIKNSSRVETAHQRMERQGREAEQTSNSAIIENMSKTIATQSKQIEEMKVLLTQVKGKTSCHCTIDWNSDEPVVGAIKCEHCVYAEKVENYIKGLKE